MDDEAKLLYKARKELCDWLIGRWKHYHELESFKARARDYNAAEAAYNKGLAIEDVMNYLKMGDVLKKLYKEERT